MTTGYVINEVGYEYNDEIYHQSEHGGGTPVMIYLDKAKAEDEVSKMNLNALMSCEIGSYAYDFSEVVDDLDEFKRIVKKYVSEDDELDLDDSYEVGEWFSSNGSKFSESDKKKIAKLVNLEFYSITEVEIDDSILPPKEKKSKKTFSNLDE